MEDAGAEADSGRHQRVLLGDLQCQVEAPSLVWRVSRSLQQAGQHGAGMTLKGESCQQLLCDPRRHKRAGLHLQEGFPAVDVGLVGLELDAGVLGPGDLLQLLRRPTGPPQPPLPGHGTPAPSSTQRSAGGAAAPHGLAQRPGGSSPGRPAP